MTGDLSGFQFFAMADNYLFSTASKLALETNQTPA
jgi:hypothetical protein